jgi:FkbM family methyltransferase
MIDGTIIPKHLDRQSPTRSRAQRSTRRCRAGRQSLLDAQGGSRSGGTARWRPRDRTYARSVWSLLTGIRQPLLTVRMFLGLAGRPPHDIQVRSSGLRFRVRGRMDVWAVKETVLDRLYERYGFAVQPGWTVIDIGAGIGEYSVIAARDALRVLAFEPYPPSFSLLRENLQINAVTTVRAYERAIAGKSGTIALDVDQQDPVLYRSREMDGGSDESALQVRAWSLGEALERCGVDRIDLLKLDCEGAEYDILGSLTPEVLERVERIVLEYHDWEGRTHDQLVHLLKRGGYTVELFPNPVHACIGYLRASRMAGAEPRPG